MFVIKEIIVVAMASIRANLLRSVLTTLGIVIGTSAVITMFALGEGAQRAVEEQIQNLGTNILTVRPGQGFRWGVASGNTRLEEDDAMALSDQLGGLYQVAPEVESRYQVSYSRYNSSNSVVGTWPSYFDVHDHEIEYGELFDQGDVQGRRRVAVLGSNVPEDLSTAPGMLIGQKVQIRGISFEILGVIKEKGGAMWEQPDDRVYIPLSTAMYRVMGNRDRLRSIFVAAPSPDQLDPLWADIDQIIRRQHRIPPGEDPDFHISQSSEFLETLNENTQTFTMLLAGIAGVSLLVGGIGIMNIMLVSVTERTREIGVRKALGATRKTILFQFLVEALVLCMLGGALGVAGGYGAAHMVSTSFGSETAVAIEIVAVAIGFSAAIGLFFGIWPARRASILDPIDALRYE